VDEYAKPSALRVYGDAALPLVERHAATLARYIVKHGLRKFNARKLRREAGLPGMKEAEPFNAAVSFLIEADWLRDDGHRAADNAGRRSSDFLVNPGVHGGCEMSRWRDLAATLGGAEQPCANSAISANSSEIEASGTNGTNGTGAPPCVSARRAAATKGDARPTGHAAGSLARDR
jgi:hypothetical protein